MNLNPTEQRAQGTTWASQRFYRPYVISSLCVALTLGFTTGTAMLFMPLLGFSLKNSWITHLQAHGMAQGFGFAGLFVMGLAFHIVPRIRNTSMNFPWPQRMTLGLVLLAIICRFFGQTVNSFNVNEILLGMSGICLLIAAGIFIFTIGKTLSKGKSRHGLPEIWFWASLFWCFIASLLNLVIVLQMIDRGARIVSFTMEDSFVHVTLIGFVANFVFGISLRVLPGLLFLPTPRFSLNKVSLILINVGISVIAIQPIIVVSNWWLLIATLIELAGFISYVLSVHIYNRRVTVRQYVLNIYGRYEWFLRSGYFWLLVGGVLQVWLSVGHLNHNIAVSIELAAPVVHVWGLGFITMIIVGMASRMVPMFEGAVLPLQRIMDLVFILLNLGVILRLGFGIIPSHNSWTGLALSGSLSTISITLFALIICLTLNPSSRNRYIEIAIEFGKNRQ